MSNAIKEQYFKRMALMEQTEAEMNRVYDQLTPESDAEETAMVIDVVAKLADNNIMHGIHFDVLNAQVLGHLTTKSKRVKIKRWVLSEKS